MFTRRKIFCKRKTKKSDRQLLTRVNVCVLLHVRFLVEPLATELAGVGPGVRVDEEVRGQSGGALERLAAHLALKAFFLKHGRTFEVVSILALN